MPVLSRPKILAGLLGLTLSLAIAIARRGAFFTAPADASLVVARAETGVTTCWIGATEGNVHFDPADLLDLGLNTYRVYGGMSRWEPEDDDGVYGAPSIAAIKGNPDVVNWAWWDLVMADPPAGSDYAWSGDDNLWRGSALSLFGALRDAGIRPVLTLRNRDNHDLPTWSPNPPRTEADWNEWWEHVFATAYWLNLRGAVRVDDYEVHNEPDNRTQGWRGTLEDYLLLLESTRDALDHVYAAYLPGRTYHLHAPATVGGSAWPREVATHLRGSDALNVHSYDVDVSDYVRAVHAWADRPGLPRLPVWLGEWGSYRDEYDSVGFGAGVVANLIRASTPGAAQVEGSHLFALYDWNGFNDLAIHDATIKGVIDRGGNRRAAYFSRRGSPDRHASPVGERAVVAVKQRPDYSAGAVGELPRGLAIELDPQAGLLRRQ